MKSRAIPPFLRYQDQMIAIKPRSSIPIINGNITDTCEFKLIHQLKVLVKNIYKSRYRIKISKYYKVMLL